MVSCASPPTGVRSALFVVSFLLILLSTAQPLLSQSATGSGYTRTEWKISGQVTDARTRAPLSRATIILSWSYQVEPPGAISRAHFASPNRITATADSLGAYEFTKVPKGSYRVIGMALGFKSDTVSVTLGADDYTLSFNLVPAAPFAIQGISVIGSPTPPQNYRVPDSPFADSARGIFARDHRLSFFQSDTRELNSRDMKEAIPLAEPDVMRALQRTPGVGTRDDYTATLWTRGATWDQTRVYFDGIPLYNPTHAAWLMGSINPEGVGSVTYMPGFRPAWISEGAAGVLMLESRRGGTEKNLQFSGDLSVVSARASLDGVLPGNSGDWMIAVRRTYIDWFTAALRSVGGKTANIPYDFSDAISRVDLNLPLGARIEASGLYERDRLAGDVPGIVRRNTAAWGNRAGQVALVAPFRNLEARLSIGGTRFGTRLLEDTSEVGTVEDDPTLPSLENALTHVSGTLEIASRTHSGSRPNWSFGLQWSSQEAEYNGPFSLTAEGIPGVDPDQMIRIPFLYQASLITRAAWVQGMFDVGSRLRFDLGLRAEQGADLANVGRVRLAPRFGAGMALDSSTFLSLGWSRSFQYAQDVGAAAGPLGPQLHLTHIWQLASSGVPALQSTITTIGIERQLWNDVVVGVSVYDRVSTGMTIPDPTPGEIASDRPLFAVAENKARGVELSLRKTSGPWSGSIGYAYANSRVEASGLSFPSAADVRHTMDATLSRRLSPTWRVSSAFSYASGVPYTRFVMGEQSLRVEDPYANRTPAYASADLSFDYSRTVGSHTVGAYMQIRNLLSRGNRVTYSGSCSGEFDNGVCSVSPRVTDRFDSGIPLLPLLGVRIVF